MKPGKDKIRLNQVYKSKHSEVKVKIIGKAGDKWKCGQFHPTDPKRFKRTHTLSNISLRKSFDLYEPSED